jgi:beta-lactamase class A
MRAGTTEARPLRPLAGAARPAVVAAGLLALLAGCAAPGTAPTPSRSESSPTSLHPASDGDEVLRADLARLEERYDARLGVTVLDTGSGRRLAYRAAERFPFASTDKVFIAAATLQEATDEDLATVVRYSSADVLEYAPVTARHVAAGMTVRALLDAMLHFSDNTAANLLVDRLGGPDAVERFLRSIGDTTTSVDRLEPDLNSAVPGDRRDTTTAAAFARDLQVVLLGDALPAARRELLDRLMRTSTTGGPYIRSGVPSTWTVADKTGSGAFGTRDDIAVVRPPGRAPIVLVLLSIRTTADAPSQDALLADATRAVVGVMERSAP